jgi:hypothetical protein
MRAELRNDPGDTGTQLRRRTRRGLGAFECGCFGDWSDQPPAERQQRARSAVNALVSTLVEQSGGVA